MESSLQSSRRDAFTMMKVILSVFQRLYCFIHTLLNVTFIRAEAVSHLLMKPTCWAISFFFCFSSREILTNVQHTLQSINSRSQFSTVWSQIILWALTTSDFAEVLMSPFLMLLWAQSGSHTPCVFKPVSKKLLRNRKQPTVKTAKLK